MLLLNWLTSQRRNLSRCRLQGKSRKSRLRVEQLEDRTLWAVRPLTLADPSYAGLSAFGESSTPTLSTDGQLVVFQSTADNLVANDTNGTSDVFVYNRSTNRVDLVSVALDGSAAGNCNQYSAPVISPDGRYIAFESRSSNPLVAGISGDQYYLRDLQTGTTSLITWNALGTGGAQIGVYGITFTGDSRHVLFVSTAGTSQDSTKNLTLDPLDTGEGNIFERNLDTNQTTLVTASLSGRGTGSCPAAVFTSP